MVGEVRAVAQGSAACLQRLQDSLDVWAGRDSSSEIFLASIVADALRCQVAEHAELSARISEVHQKLDSQTACAEQVNALMNMGKYSTPLEKNPAPKVCDDLLNVKMKAVEEVCHDCLRRVASFETVVCRLQGQVLACVESRDNLFQESDRQRAAIQEFQSHVRVLAGALQGMLTEAGVQCRRISAFEGKVYTMSVDANKTIRHFDQAVRRLEMKTARVRRCHEHVASEVSESSDEDEESPGDSRVGLLEHVSRKGLMPKAASRDHLCLAECLDKIEYPQGDSWDNAHMAKLLSQFGVLLLEESETVKDEAGVGAAVWTMPGETGKPAVYFF